jgi:hypothetical protein
LIYKRIWIGGSLPGYISDSIGLPQVEFGERAFNNYSSLVHKAGLSHSSKRPAFHTPKKAGFPSSKARLLKSDKLAVLQQKPGFYFAHKKLGFLIRTQTPGFLVAYRRIYSLANGTSA